MRETDLERARETAKGTLVEFRQMQERIQEQDRGIARKTAQLNVLENLQAKFEGFGEGAKAILGGKLDDLVEKDKVAIISKELKVQSAYTKALETLLGPAAEALFIGNTATALSVIDKLDAELLGRACVQIEAGQTGNNAQASLPDGIVAATSVVTARDDNFQSPVERLLEGCYFAESLQQFIDFWQANPNFNFLLTATKNGEIIDSRGLVHGGRTSGKKSSSVLERESEIRSLRAQIKDEREQLNGLRDEAAGIEERRSAAELEVEEQRQRLSELASEVSGLVAEERNQSQKLEQNQRSRHSAEEELERLDAKNSDSVAELDTAKQELETAEKALNEERQSGTDLEDAIAHAREMRDAKREALSDVRLELAEKKQRLESVDRALNEVQRQTASLQERIIRRNQEIDTLNEQIQQLARTGALEAEKSAELEKTLALSTEQLDADRELLKEMDLQINGIDSGLSGRRNEVRSFDQEMTKLEIRLAEERSQIGFIQNSVMDEYQYSLDGVDWKAQLWEAGTEMEKRVNLDEIDDPDQISAKPKEKRPDPTDEELAELDKTDWKEIEDELTELRGRISNMGPVNLDAISEYADLKERYDFLKNQSEDLWNAKNKLVETIDEINATSQTLFRETFEQVRKNFAFTYGKISAGGDSDLQLVDSEDPLESGIEIIARPPGTRLKSVTLLSGGQRTMAAVALLFAIYMVKPSPFCVLDEIDAALDDANIGRFCDTLHGFTDKSQFLIITHNKRTISNADTVFGVTMPEKGVSKLLSMRFNKDTNRPELAEAENSKPF